MQNSSFLIEVAEALDVGWATFVQGKLNGGANGRKGINYEDHYAAYCVASELVGTHLDGDGSNTRVQQQAQAIVDDLALTRANGRTFVQCKNAKSVSWGDTDRSISAQFAAQMRLPGAKKSDRTVLVVSFDHLKSKLERDTPREIASHTHVECFQHCDGILARVVNENRDLATRLTKLSNIEDPTNDVLEIMMCALLSALRKSGVGATCSGLLEHARDFAPRYFSRVSNLPGQGFEEGFEDAVARIPGLSYGVVSGVFYWENDVISGSFPFGIEDGNFMSFQRSVIREKPESLSDFVFLALSHDEPSIPNPSR